MSAADEPAAGDGQEFLTDSHCHLDEQKFEDDLDDVLARAGEAGVRRIVAVNTRPGIEGAERTVALARRHDGVRAVVGLHPHEAKLNAPGLVDKFEEIARRPEVAAVGEAGLDFHYDLSPRDTQRQVFREMLRMARRVGKPVVIHTREAEEETLRIMDEEKGWELGGVVHCFSGGVDMAEHVIARGFHLSFTGAVTFPQAERAREVLARVPTGRVLIETDAPWLAPVPHRGRRNEPAYVALVAAAYARVRGMSAADAARVTSRNAARLFGFPLRDEPRVAYTIRGSLYLNITNRCTLACRFCPKRTDWLVKGHYLRLHGEPTADEIVREARTHDLAALDEVVFCGFGEPTLRLDVLKEVAARLRRAGARKVRLDTDGLGSLVHGRDIAPELRGLVDAVSVSMNAPDAATYASICPSRHGERAYAAARAFIAAARGAGIPEVTATVVAMPGLDVERCRRIAEEELRVSFRAREYNEVG